MHCAPHAKGLPKHHGPIDAYSDDDETFSDMSRFYDALRQASRFHRSVTGGGSAPQPWESFGIEPVVRPLESPAETAAGTMEAVAAAAGVATAPHESRRDPWIIMTEPRGSQRV